MMKYETYKPSEIDWIGNVPKHWEVIRIKDAFHQISKTGSDIGIDNYIPLENIESQTGKLLQRVSNENNEVTNLFKSGDILVNKLRPYLAKVYLPEFDGGVSGEVIVFRVSKVKQKKISSKFYFYRFLSSQFIGKINSITDGVKMPRTNPTKINCLDIAVPPLSEQTAIAQYLDAKTQAIDKKINLLTKKADYYKELRKSIINDAVCKGLVKNVKLKESGIEWIGKIPEHWEVKRIKDIYSSLAGGTPSTKEKEYWIGEIPWIPSGKVQNNIVVPEVVEDFISVKALKESSTKIAKSNSILIALTGATCSNIGYLTFDTTINQSIVALLPKRKLETKYYFYFLISGSEKIRTYMTGGAQGGINQEDVKFLKVLLPSLEEQTAIANYLDEKTQKIDAIVSNIGKQIGTLKELRKTLINDVVTGKIKVVTNGNK